MTEAFTRAYAKGVIAPGARRNGENMRDPLARIFSKLKFDPSLIAIHGALSLDVYYGADIAAIEIYNPNRHIASEPISYWTGRLEFAGQERKFSIEELGANTNLTVVDGDPLDGVNAVLTKQAPVGLVTMLNVYPTKLREGWIYKVGEYANKILVPDGLMVISVLEETQVFEDLTLNEYMHLKEHGLKDSPGIDWRYYKESLSRAGSQYIVGKNPSTP